MYVLKTKDEVPLSFRLLIELKDKLSYGANVIDSLSAPIIMWVPSDRSLTFDHSYIPDLFLV